MRGTGIGGIRPGHPAREVKGMIGSGTHPEPGMRTLEHEKLVVQPAGIKDPTGIPLNGIEIPALTQAGAMVKDPTTLEAHACTKTIAVGTMITKTGTMTMHMTMEEVEMTTSTNTIAEPGMAIGVRITTDPRAHAHRLVQAPGLTTKHRLGA